MMKKNFYDPPPRDQILMTPGHLVVRSAASLINVRHKLIPYLDLFILNLFIFETSARVGITGR